MIAPNPRLRHSVQPGEPVEQETQHLQSDHFRLLVKGGWVGPEHISTAHVAKLTLLE